MVDYEDKYLQTIEKRFDDLDNKVDLLIDAHNEAKGIRRVFTLIIGFIGGFLGSHTGQ